MSTLVALAILLSSQMAGGEFIYKVQSGDSLQSIAARNGIEARVIAEANGLKSPFRLKPRQTLNLDNRHIVPESNGMEIVVNIPQRMLFHFSLNGQAWQSFPIAAGRPGWKTPLGSFEITTREKDKTWIVPVSIQREMASKGERVLTRVPPGPENPLGKYWLGLSLPGVGIHGTNAPSSIYTLQTHGCMRLHPDDIESLFAVVETGSRGKTVYQPVLIAQIAKSIFLEVHPDAYRLEPDPAPGIRSAIEAAGLVDLVDWTLIKEVIRKHDGIARDVTLGFPSGHVW